jgi:hypothetical protein
MIKNTIKFIEIVQVKFQLDHFAFQNNDNIYIFFIIQG